MNKNKIKELDILVSTDRNYIPLLKVLLHSLFSNNIDCKIHIHVLHSSLNKKDLSEIEKTIAIYDGVFSSYRISANHESETMNKKTALPKETYFRLLCMDYLPATVKKVLYLDCDIVINGPLKEFYDTDLTGYMFAAAYDNAEVIGEEFDVLLLPTLRVKQYDLMPDIYKYVNTGVLLMNVEYMRELVTTEEIIDMIEKLGSRNILHFHDQDFINFVFHKYILYIDYVMYNYLPIYKDWDELKPGAPVIIHFLGPFKPWKDDYFDVCEKYLAHRNNRTRPFAEQAKELYEKYAAMG